MSTDTEPKPKPGRELDVYDPRLSRFELVREGARRDGVEIVHYAPRFPVPGTRAERRIERTIALLFLIAVTAGRAAAHRGDDDQHGGRRDRHHPAAAAAQGGHRARPAAAGRRHRRRAGRTDQRPAQGRAASAHRLGPEEQRRPAGTAGPRGRQPDPARGGQRQRADDGVPRDSGGCDQQVGRLAGPADPPARAGCGRRPQEPGARQGQRRWHVGQLRGVLEDLHPCRLPREPVRAADQPAAVPVPPVAVLHHRQRAPDLRPGHPPVADAAAGCRRRRLRGNVRLQGPDRTRLLGAAMRRRKVDVRELPAKTAVGLDERLQAAGLLRRTFNKVFPDHWSFLLGEIALYSFIVLLLTGTFLALFFDPSMEEVPYNGSYTPLRGIMMSRAYATSLDISFDVRGGLIMRQMHHWAALLFMAAIVVHMMRIFFTGAFRKPRELNWIIGLSLFWLGFTEGFAGYSLPDDALSGTGLRIANAIVQSIPLIGTWTATSLFGGEFPGMAIVPRLYILHVFLLPGIILALIVVHLGLLVKQKHTQWPGPGRTEHNVVGIRMFPGFALKSGGFFMLVFAVTAFLGGLFQINPIWLFGPY